MYILEINKIIQIIFIAFSVNIAARIHQIFLPKSYSSILDFRYSKDLAKTIRSSSIRLIYLAIISILAYLYGIDEMEIMIGVGTAAFLNVWPAIVQYNLLSLSSKIDKLRLLFGYICFICFSVIFSWISIEYILKSLQGESVFGFADSKGFEILFSLLLTGLAVNVESILSRLAKFDYSLDAKTFKTDLEILLTQTALGAEEIVIYQYEIEQAVKENDITSELLETILILEKINRGAWYYKLLEILFCKIKVLQKFAIRQDISVGIGQIKISTAQRLLKKNPYTFIAKMLDPSFGINLCASYLNEIVKDYESDFGCNNENITIYEYIASEYLSGTYNFEAEIVKLYAAVLEAVDSSNICVLMAKRKNSNIENRFICFIERCEKILLNGKLYYVFEPTSLTVKMKNCEKNFKYLHKMKSADNGFFIKETKDTLILKIPVLKGKVNMLIENLNAGFLQHKIKAELSLSEELTYEAHRKGYFLKEISPKG